MATLASGGFGGGYGVSGGLYSVVPKKKKIKVPPTIINEASRLSGIAYNADIWGQPIPITWNLAKVQGFILWRSSYRQSLVTEGWKRTSPNTKPAFQTIMGYDYRCDLLYSLGQTGNPDRTRVLGRLFLNNVCVYDRPGGYRYPGVNFVFYTGSEDQMPDVQYQKDKGDWSVAYRGQMCVGIHNLPIQDFGITLPTMIAELYDNPSLPVDEVQFPAVYQAAPTFQAKTFWDWGRRKAYIPLTYTGASTANYIGEYDLDLEQFIGAYPSANVGPFTAHCYIPWKNWGITTDGGGNSAPINVIDMSTGVLISQYGQYSSGLSIDFSGPTIIQCVKYDVCPSKDHAAYLVILSVFLDEVGILSVSPTGQLQGLYHFETPTNVRDFACDRNDSRIYYAYGNTIGRIDLNNGFYDEPDWVLMETSSGYNSVTNVIAWNGTVIIFRSHSTPITNSTIQIRSYDAVTGEVLWTSISNYGRPSEENPREQSNIEGGTLGWADGNNLVILTLSNGGIEHIVPSGGSFGSTVWDSDSQSTYIRPNFFVSTVRRQRAVSPQGGTILLRTVLREMAEMVGYESSQLSFVGIDDYVIGAVLAKSYSLNDLFNSICPLFRISRTEVDGKLKFFKALPADGVTVANITINYSEIAWLKEGQNDFSALDMNRMKKTDMPGSVAVNFISAVTLMDDVYSWNRPSKATRSAEEIKFAVPLVMTKDQVAGLTQEIMYDTWSSQMTAEFKLPQKFIAVDPGSIVELQRPEFIDLLRVLEVTDNADWSKSVSAEFIRSRSGVRITTDPIVPLSEARVGRPDSQMLLFNTPVPLALSDDPADRLQFYFGMSGIGQVNWPGGYVAKSENGAAYAAIATFLPNTSLFGRSLTLMPEVYETLIPEGMILKFNGTNPLPANMTVQELMDNRARHIAFYGANGRWELIQWGSSVLNSNGTVTISNIIRGVRGTEWLMDTHKVGDYFIPLDSSIGRELLDQGTFGDVGHYKAVGFGQAINDIETHEHIMDGNSIKPWPVLMNPMIKSGSDLVITWERQDRKGLSEWGNSTAQPMSEVAEAYELEVYALDNTLKRSVTGLSARTYTYTAVDQATDGFTAPAPSIRIKVYQMSAVVGRGFSRRVQLDV